jgi:hypothetical protein
VILVTLDASQNTHGSTKQCLECGEVKDDRRPPLEYVKMQDLHGSATQSRVCAEAQYLQGDVMQHLGALNRLSLMITWMPL